MILGAQNVPHLLEAFDRVNRRSYMEIDRIGLGLPLVKTIVGQHDGKIRVESEPGKGGIFSVLLPLSGKRPV